MVGRGPLAQPTEGQKLTVGTPGRFSAFIRARNPERAGLHRILSCVTPIILEGQAGSGRGETVRGKYTSLKPGRNAESRMRCSGWRWRRSIWSLLDPLRCAPMRCGTTTSRFRGKAGPARAAWRAPDHSANRRTAGNLGSPIASVRARRFQRR